MQIKYFIQLIRPINLAITALAMYAIRWFVIIPILKTCVTDNGYLAPYLNETEFLLLVLSVVLINAAGYVVNDFCDVETDRINKPDRLIVTQHISYKTTTVFYYALNLIALIFASIISIKVHAIRLSSIHLASIGLLWMYAMYLKKMPFLGNFSVAILSATVLLMPLFYEPIVFYNQDETFKVSLSLILTLGFIISAFAFITTLIRELIKDLQDVDGDQQTGCNTLPIYTSINTTKTITVICIGISILFIAWIQYHLFINRTTYHLFTTWNLYCSMLLQLPLFFTAIKLLQAKESKQYKVLSTGLKLIMAAGILSLLFVKLWFDHA
jgi:4-hydroxybenzoate polyprenyltransferase